MVNLITTDSYHNLFPLLVEKIRERGSDLNSRNIIFCEEKISLMIERFLCYQLKGTFNTEVYSFGNFLRAKKPMSNLLSKEGSAMVVKNILSTVNLKCFKASKVNLAPTLYELIMQLKSAKVSPNELLSAIEKSSGVLKNKLQDIYSVYDGYERFILEKGFIDQSNLLSYFPSVVNEEQSLVGANVFIVGFSGFTAQIRSAIDALIEKTGGLTAILCEGDNPLVFVCETANYIRELCKQKGYNILSERVDGGYDGNSKLIVDNLFNPFLLNKKVPVAESDEKGVFVNAITSPYQEVEAIGAKIKSLIMSGNCSFKDVSVIIPNDSYNGYIRSVFSSLDIPFFLDEKKKAEHHPLVKLILCYIDVFRKNFERKSVLAFIKNPLFLSDKKLADDLENYIIKYNINYFRIKEPFTLRDGDENLDALNEQRQRFLSLFDSFNVEKMLAELSVKEKIEEYSSKLKGYSYFEEGAVNEQVYQAVVKVLEQMQLLLSGVNLSLSEFKSVFLSGVSALELSIIPQYSDAVFVGGYKEIALAKAKHLFAIGLTCAVPEVKPDVALLSDGDISMLEKIKVLVEPKIKIVNHRMRENVALALSAFSNSLYITYPICSVDGTKTEKSEIIDSINKLFKERAFDVKKGYLTEKQAIKTFASDCRDFADCYISDFTEGSSYYLASQSDLPKRVVEWANSELKVKLDREQRVLIEDYTSPTAIEDYNKCPYQSFLSHALRLRPREEGKVDGLSVGNFMHEIFSKYCLSMHLVKDRESSDRLFDEIKEQVLNREEYKKFLSDGATATTVKRVIKECKEYCYKTYLSFSNSSFKVKNTEASFGDGKEYPAISLLGGKVKIKGKIDRVDESKDYFRVIDYKTGESDASDKSLFAGVKLQLYLYGYAVSSKHKDSKRAAGLYYLPVSNKFKSADKEVPPMAVGRTLGEQDALFAQDSNFESLGKSEFLPAKKDDKGNLKNTLDGQDFKKYMDYAVKISELSAMRLSEGVIVPSPYGETCKYCKFKGICTNANDKQRLLQAVKERTITNAIKGDENGADD